MIFILLLKKGSVKRFFYKKQISSFDLKQTKEVVLIPKQTEGYSLLLMDSDLIERVTEHSSRVVSKKIVMAMNLMSTNSWKDLT